MSLTEFLGYLQEDNNLNVSFYLNFIFLFQFQLTSHDLQIFYHMIDKQNLIKMKSKHILYILLDDWVYVLHVNVYKSIKLSKFEH